ncbi:ABC transporter substrate-binding protein [Aeromonas schubertii]|uniref:ABC transporter substrate-binding protein n=1 Tax=Aeromonas schubertii TaxID=652 RepID=A0ABS7VEP4_9GAMM|nr:ABC transporter substrate-binding protein [Aeromonas schubertii]MBZ6067853.1 ABC transporter substrate-binding protein [Aeromonas schubertii]
MRKEIAALLLALITLPSWANPQRQWQQTLQEARGQQVYLHAWGGSPEVNRYLAWSADEIKKRFDITLIQVKVDDIAPSVASLLAQKRAGKAREGTMDLLWVNGENFKSMKDNALLGAPFTAELPNMALVDEGLPVERDFTVPVEGLEAPWGMGQLNLMVDKERVPSPPTNAAALLAWAQTHPGRFTYPKPPQFHGSSFLKQMLLDLIPDPAPLYGPTGQSDAARVTAPLWAFLDALHPRLWRAGKLFPTGAAESRQLLDDGELDMALSFNLQEAAYGVLSGNLPEGVEAVVMQKGALTNAHFLAIPFNARSRAGAKVVVNFLLSPEAQARKADPAIWGDPGVLRPEALPKGTLPALRFAAQAEPHPSWQLYLEREWARRYGQ